MTCQRYESVIVHRPRNSHNEYRDGLGRAGLTCAAGGIALRNHTGHLEASLLFPVKAKHFQCGLMIPHLLPSNRSHLPLKELIPISLLSPTFRSISLSPQISPFLGPVQRILFRGPPYTAELASLGSYTHISRNVFAEILVRAEARWILEEMEIPKLPNAVWEEAFSRRFLPSWRRYREGDEHWRAVFLRTLRRLEHRSLGCTHEESWTVRYTSGDRIHSDSRR